MTAYGPEGTALSPVQTLLTQYEFPLALVTGQTVDAGALGQEGVTLAYNRDGLPEATYTYSQDGKWRGFPLLQLPGL